MIFGMATAVVVFYATYTFFDVLSLYIRVAASLNGNNAAGAAFEKIMNTFKRTSLFLFPPILGFFVLMESPIEMFWTFLASSLASGTLLVLMNRRRSTIIALLTDELSLFQAGRSAFASTLVIMRRLLCHSTGTNQGLAEKHCAIKPDYNKKLVTYGSWIFFTHANSVFILNAAVSFFPVSGPVLLQSLGLINGMGSIFLAFLVDPLVSRHLDNGLELDVVINSFFRANLLVYFFLGPALHISFLIFASTSTFR